MINRNFCSALQIKLLSFADRLCKLDPFWRGRPSGNWFCYMTGLNVRRCRHDRVWTRPTCVLRIRRSADDLLRPSSCSMLCSIAAGTQTSKRCCKANCLILFFCSAGRFGSDPSSGHLSSTVDPSSCTSSSNQDKRRVQPNHHRFLYYSE